MSLDESELTLLNTRPQGQAEALDRLVHEAQMHSYSCPLIDIETLSTPPELSNPLHTFDVWIFISTNAVQAFHQKVSQAFLSQIRLNQAISVYAIGKATAAALENIGLKAVTSDRPFDSERLLNTLSQTCIRKALIVKGEGGRDVLANELMDRGVDVEEWPLYRRVPATFCDGAWQKFQGSAHPVLLFTSDQAWQFFKRRLNEQRHSQASWAWACRQDVIVFSERIANSLRKDGVTGKILVVNQPSNDGILKCLNEFKQKNR